jgi:DNA-binding NarL/FixJ family response regulator
MVAYINSGLPYEIVPAETSYLIFAVFAFLAWIGISRRVNDSIPVYGKKGSGYQRNLMYMVIIIALAAFFLRKMNDLIDFAVEQYDDFLFVPVYIVLPPLAYLLLGLLGDRGRERNSMTGVLLLFLIAIQLAFLGNSPDSFMAVPLVIINHFIGVYLVYFLVTIPIPFFASTKYPVFIASAGIAIYIISRTFNIFMDRVLPGSVKVAGTPLFVSTAIAALVFLILLHFIYQGHKDKTLAAALHAFIHESADRKAANTNGTLSSMESLFTPEEREISLMLLEGKTRSDITRKMRLTAAQTNHLMDAIQDKVTLMGGADLFTSAIIKDFSLTRREADMLRGLQRNMTNAEIAEELVLSEGTVKIHIRNLMGKIPEKNRRNISEWIDGYKGKYTEV